MKYLRRLVWYGVTRLLAVCLALGVAIMAVSLAMNASNVYIILKDGLARRCQVVMQGTDEGELTSYFSEGCLRTDPALSIARQGNSPYQLYYSITGFDHRLNLTSIWSWPWEDTVRVTLEERVPAIDGRLNTAGREWADALGLTGAPPRWQSGRYQAVLTLENGHWKIKTLTLMEYLNE